MKVSRWFAPLLALVTSSAANAAVIYDEDFNGAAPTTTLASTGFTSAARFVYKPGVHDSNLLELYGTGGSGVGTVTVTMTLDQAYNFYNGDTGEATFQVRRQAGASSVVAHLREGNTIVSSTPIYSFVDFGTWHALNFEVTSDATAVDNIQFVMRRGSGSATSTIWVDDFVAVPEPSSLGLIIAGSFCVLSRRRAMTR